MKPQILFKMIFVFLLFSLSSCTESPKKTEEPTNIEPISEEKRSWKTQMQLLEKTLTELYPLAYDARKFNASENEEFILKNLETLKTLAKEVNHSPMTQISDPSLQFISIDFKEQIELTWSSFLDKKKEFARFNVLHLSSYCIECHTHNSYGPSFGSEKLSQQLMSLSSFEKAEYLTATRRYADALKAYNEFFQDTKSSYNDFFKTEKAAQTSLAITIRYMKNSSETENIIRSLKKAQNLPLYLKTSLDVWLKDIEAWKKEKKSSLSTATVRKRLDQVQTRRLEGGSLAGEVLVLRSLSDLHDLLLKPLKGERMSETLYLLGLAYSQTEGSLFLNLDEKYYETCIQKNPKSPWAKKCYEKLEELLTSDYSGSAGTFIPADVKAKLENLKKLVF